VKVGEDRKLPNAKMIMESMDDEDGYPTAIKRDTTSSSEVRTLFCIFMDLMKEEALVRVEMGRSQLIVSD